jgi:hypothetical protein
MLHLAGPSRATLRDFSIGGGQTGLLVEKCDQPGGRVFMQGANVSGGRKVGFLIDRLAHADVSLHDFGHSDSGVGVKVIGGRPLDAAGGGRNVIFSGSSSNSPISYDVNEGGRLMARDIWYEGKPETFMRCTGSGSFTLHGAIIAPELKPGSPGIEVKDFRGDLAFISVEFETPIAVAGPNRDLNLLVLGCQGRGDWFAGGSPDGRAAVLSSRQFDPKIGTTPFADVGKADPVFIQKMLAPTRAQRPRPLGPVKDGLTDLRLYRVSVSGCQTCVHLKGE